MDFRQAVVEGIPDYLPAKKEYDLTVNHAPKRKEILNIREKKLALKNALRYFDPKFHAELAPEFAEELETYGRIYMYRFRPDYPMFARGIDEYPAKCKQAAAIMLMIQNNLDPAVAQHPHEFLYFLQSLPIVLQMIKSFLLIRFHFQEHLLVQELLQMLFQE